MFITVLFKSLLVILVLSVQVPNSSSQLDEVQSLTAVLEDDNVIDSLNIDPVLYREFDENVTYALYLQSDQRAMVDLYNFTQLIVDFLIPKEPYPKGILKIKTNDIEVNNLRRNWKPLVKHYYIISLLIIAIFLFGVLMPVIGFFFYCFRCCCGKCGARTQPFDKKYDGCKKVLHATLLIGLTILLLYGVVCTFICSVYIDDALQQIPDNVKNTINDTLLYTKRMQKQVDYLFIKNFNDLKENLFKFLDKCDYIISDKLAEYSDSVSLNYLTQIVNNLPTVRNDLTRINDNTNELRNSASKLSTMLNHLKLEILVALKNCPQCSEISDEINRLQITIDYDFLVNVTVPIRNITKILNDSIIDEINKGQMNFEKIRRTISLEIDDEKDKIRNAIFNTGHDIELIVKSVNEKIDYHTYYVTTQTLNMLGDSKYYKYTSEIFYIGLVLSFALLLITLLIVLGLICGICGKRPDGYDDDCCNKGCGSRFLLLGVALQFIFSFFLAIGVLVLIITSLSWQRIVCDPLRNPNNSQVISDMNEFFELNVKTFPIKLNFTDVINNCHQNKSFFKVFDLDNVYNLRNYTNNLEIEEHIQKLRQKIKFDDRITLITVNGKKKLLDLANSELSEFPFYRFIDELSRNITSLDLLAISKKLKSLKNELPRDDYLDDKVYRFEQLSEHVKYIQNKCNELKNLTLRVENNLRLNFSSLHDAILQLINRIENAQNFLDTHGRELIIKLATKFADVFTNKIQKYSDRIIDKVHNSIGNCAQISYAYNSTLVFACDNIINPVNVLWMSILVCLILFIPTIMVSVKLAMLYQKAEPYPGPLYRGDYSYDNYGEHDINIPLTSAKKRRHRSKKRDTVPANLYSDEAFNEPAVSRTRNQSGPSSSQKQWEEYSTAPPVYHQPEYERPPPYYYPGPGSQK